MATAETNILSNREAARLVARLRVIATAEPTVLRSVLLDLPEDDINVVRGVLRISKERAKVYVSNKRADVR